jgi:hypothetical protein
MNSAFVVEPHAARIQSTSRKRESAYLAEHDAVALPRDTHVDFELLRVVEVHLLVVAEPVAHLRLAMRVREAVSAPGGWCVVGRGQPTAWVQHDRSECTGWVVRGGQGATHGVGAARPPSRQEMPNLEGFSPSI